MIGFQDLLHRLLNDTGRQLQLCCSREVGNIPPAAFASRDACCGAAR